MAPKQTGDTEAKRAEEVQPEIYYIPDKDGKLRAAYLDRITFEEFKKRISELAERVEAPPSYVLNGLSVTGAAADGQAALQVEFSVQNRQAVEGNWVRIPLKLGSAILPLRDTPQYEGPGEFFLHFEHFFDQILFLAHSLAPLVNAVTQKSVMAHDTGWFRGHLYPIWEGCEHTPHPLPDQWLSLA